jgi:predicted Zn-dependent protease
VAKAVEEVMANVLSSNADPAFDISPYQEPQTHGRSHAMDADLIVKRLEEFNAAMRKDYPSVYYDAILSHTRARYQFLNSNGVDFCQNWGYYGFTTMFTAKDGKQMSSFNYTSFETSELDNPLLDYNFTAELMRQITQQTLTQPIPQNFTGEVLLCPFVTGELLDSLISQQFGSSGLLTNSSRFPDHVGQRVLDARLSVYNKPSDPRLAIKDMVTSDGYVAQEGAIIENGVLKHYPSASSPPTKWARPEPSGLRTASWWKRPHASGGDDHNPSGKECSACALPLAIPIPTETSAPC